LKILQVFDFHEVVCMGFCSLDTFEARPLTVKTTVRTSLIGWALVRKVAKAADGTPHAVEFVFRGCFGRELTFPKAGDPSLKGSMPPACVIHVDDCFRPEADVGAPQDCPGLSPRYDLLAPALLCCMSSVLRRGTTSTVIGGPK
jgi:hypothetical protein